MRAFNWTTKGELNLTVAHFTAWIQRTYWTGTLCLGFDSYFDGHDRLDVGEHRKAVSCDDPPPQLMVKGQ